MTNQEVDGHVVLTLAKVAGITIPDDDIEALVRAFRNYQAEMQALDSLDIDDFDPVVTFDPRW